MASDFFAFTNSKLDKLTPSEKKIFDYVVRNLHEVKDMNIRTLSSRCYVSTTSMFRFVKKLGFEGYSDFSNTLRLTDFSAPAPKIPAALWQENYMESYLKNVIESVRVIDQGKLRRFNTLLDEGPTLYMLAQGLSREVAEYAQHLFTVLGFPVSFPRWPHEVAACVSRIERRDILFAFSFSGQNQEVLHTIETVLARVRPSIVSVTSSTNNPIQNLSDLDFYVFADGISFGGFDITSRISMVAVVEALVYSRLIARGGTLLPSR